MEASLEEIVAFIRVVDAGSFTAAARVMGVSKASVSRRVAVLENKLGVRLIERSTRTSRLTELGTEYYERISRALSDIDEAAHAVNQLQATPRGHLRITAPVDWGPTFAGMLDGFTQLHPEVTVEVVLLQRVVDLVSEGFDLAVRAGSLPDSALIARRVGFNHSQLFASPDYLAEHGTPTTVAELADHKCILFRSRTGRERWTLTGPEGERVVDVSGSLSGNNFVFVGDAAIAGAGIARMPRMSCLHAVQEGRLVRVLPEHEAGIYPVHLVYPSARFVSTKVRVFCEYATEWWSQLFQD